MERSPTDAETQVSTSRDSGYTLSPVNFRRRTARLVSYYALFK